MDLVHDFQVDVVAEFEDADLITAAMLNSCVMPVYVPERVEEIRAMAAEEKKEVIESAFKHSLGSGHNAAGFMPVLLAGKVPRIETLRIARQPRGIDILQSSTRRIDHRDWLGVYEPEPIKRDTVAHQIFGGAVRQSRDYYEAVLGKANNEKGEKFLRQYAMLGTPLFLMTGISHLTSVRGLWQFVLEGSNEDMPSIAQEASARTKQMMLDNPNYEIFFREWKSNYNPLSHLPTSSDFLREENPRLEALLISAEGQDVLRGRKPAHVIGYTDPFDLSPEEAWEMLHEQPENLEAATLTFLARTSIANHHDMFRQRELRAVIEPIRQSVGERPYSYSVPDEVKEIGMDGLLSSTSDRLIDAYFKLVEIGVPSRDAQGVLPHSLDLSVVYRTGLWDLAHVSADRSCRHARPDLERWWNSIGDYVREEVPAAGALMHPKGKQFGYCPDKTPCERCFPKK